MVRNIIFVFQMKNSIPRYTFYKNKYGSELLVDVVELKYVKNAEGKEIPNDQNGKHGVYVGRIVLSFDK